MPTTYLDEFKKTYERPQVDGLIVGFSGIDPQKKKGVVVLSPEEQEVIKQLILTELSGSSGCQCDPSNLSDEQKNLVDNIINNRLKQLIINYNGGEILGDDYIPDDENEDNTGGNKTIVIDNSGYDNDSNTVIAEINPALINHELINGLLGGNDKGHFHLTHDELKCLRLLIASFFPYLGSDDSSGGDSSGGGSSGNDPYAIVMPASNIKPVNPVFPVTPDDATPTDPDDLADYDPNFGMPSGTPPAWEIKPFPNGFTADSGFNKLYYGGTPVNPKKNILAVYADKKGNADYIEGVITSADAKTWVTNNSERIPFATDSKTVFDLCFEPNYSGIYALYENKSTSAKAINTRYVYRSSSTSTTTSASAVFTVEEANSICWAEPLKAMLVAGKTGYATLMKFPSAASKYLKATTINSVGMPVNPRGAAFHPLNQVLCLCGPNGTAVSSDGATWFVNPDAPKNMTNLFYREDLACFVAYSSDDKFVYFSNDGGTWYKGGGAPIPLATVTALDFNPLTKVFCAAGLGDKGVYFSMDLNHWTFVNVRNTTTDIAGLISLPDKGLYVAIPTSGAYYYTFDYNSWASA